jgi:hypothetical protein
LFDFEMTTLRGGFFYSLLGSNSINLYNQRDPAFAYIPDRNRGMPALSGLKTTLFFKK